jgi:hypothetical protein
LTGSQTKKVRSLSSVLNEYVQLKEKTTKRDLFLSSFGKDAFVEDTWRRLSLLLDDYLSYRNRFENGKREGEDFFQDLSIPKPSSSLHHLNSMNFQTSSLAPNELGHSSMPGTGNLTPDPSLLTQPHFPSMEQTTKG